MDLNFWTKFIGFLLPKGRAFSIVIDKFLKSFFTGLAIVPKLVHDQLSSIFTEILPRYSNSLLKWSNQFGFSNIRTQAQIENSWSETGGQSPHYLQTQLQLNGFVNCYVHEWWKPMELPLQTRNPIPYIDRVNNNLLVNKIQTAGLNYIYQDGDGSQDGLLGGCQDGSFSGVLFQDKKYFAKDDPDLYPNYFYVCSQTFGVFASIDTGTLQELERLIYKIKPMHLRCILLVNEGSVLKSKIGSTTVLKDEYDNDIVLKDEVSE